MNPTDDVLIRKGTADDVPALLSLIQSLAEFEKLSQEVVATAYTLRHHLFDQPTATRILMIDLDGESVGYALYFVSFSTFLGCPGIYLEDLFVLPDYRGRGFGQRVLVRLAQIASEKGYGRVEWSVLDWNTRAIEFYKELGAKPMSDWTMYRLDGDDLERLANRAD